MVLSCHGQKQAFGAFSAPNAAFAKKDTIIMRKHIRNMLLEILPTIWDGVKYAVGNESAAETVLSDCYAAAVAVGDTLEQGLSAGRFSYYNDIISALKANFEFLYDAIPDDDLVSDVSVSIKNQIALLKKALEAESEVKIEIVFMPYNAGMWDSMESIWLAAKDDPPCDVYVVPIPYYSRNPDQSFGELKYEGESFPDYVPVTHYDLYDLEMRRPDAVYIHNPYDEHNLVTSVDPRFYSHRLKKHTDMLVYVPYFVVAETIAEHFCSVSAVRHADIIIAQSEPVRKTYAKYAGEKKVIALGSPKIDKVINTKREDQLIPDEWKKLTYKPDGTKKKIVLYLSSIGAVLGGEKLYLAKLRSVFEIFRNNDNAVLWWRPHPLSAITFQSMRPRLLKEYLAIVESYKREGFGIFDDTPDLHRAVALSDAYYGDSSSVLILYCATGKPMMLQNVFCARDEMPDDLPIETFYDDGGSYWFTVYAFRALFKMDKLSFEIEHKGAFKHERAYLHLYSHIDAIGGKLYFAPYQAEEIGVYNIETGKIERITAEKTRLPKIFTDRKFDAGACRRAFREIVEKIDSTKVFRKNIDSIEKLRECVFYEFSFAGLPGFLQYITSQEDETKRKLHDRQLEIIEQKAANADGSCGKKTHNYVSSLVK